MALRKERQKEKIWQMSHNLPVKLKWKQKRRAALSKGFGNRSIKNTSENETVFGFSLEHPNYKNSKWRRKLRKLHEINFSFYTVQGSRNKIFRSHPKRLLFGHLPDSLFNNLETVSTWLFISKRSL